jgi:mono/diheme cytochrome c family protein
MYHVRLAILALSIGVGFIAFSQSPTTTGADIAAGRELFHRHCSVCHGVDAKGNGSMYDPQAGEPERRVRPANLAILSKQSAGKFPADHVRDAIYSKGSIPPHGTPQMPAWGDVFYNLKSNPKLLEKRVRDLIAYIESIQATTK